MEIKGFSNKIAEIDKKAEDKKKVPATPKKSLQTRILDTFFLSSLPKQEEGYVQVNRTTQELQDELEPMMIIGKSDLNSYLDRHGYKLVADTDGSVKWAIWRVI